VENVTERMGRESVVEGMRRRRADTFSSVLFEHL
jgi:hypothetical protein